jgi:hypothetical protein
VLWLCGVIGALDFEADAGVKGALDAFLEAEEDAAAERDASQVRSLNRDKTTDAVHRSKIKT